MLAFESPVGWSAARPGLARLGPSGECRPRGPAGRFGRCVSCRDTEAGAPSFAVRQPPRPCFGEPPLGAGGSAARGERAGAPHGTRRGPGAGRGWHRSPAGSGGGLRPVRPRLLGTCRERSVPARGSVPGDGDFSGHGAGQ